MKNSRKWRETPPPAGVIEQTLKDELSSGSRVLPVHEAAVLEVVTVTSDLQLPAGETFPLVEGDLQEEQQLHQASTHYGRDQVC